MRLPPQGGLPPAGTVGGALLEIACDESGFSGSNLLHPATPVITHASVDLAVAEAAELIAGLGPASTELKSGQFLRGPGTGAGAFLAALRGRAHVHRVDKEFFLLTRIVDLFLAEPSYASGTRLTDSQRPAARTLHRARGGPGWPQFLAAFEALVRVKRHRRPDRRALEAFLAARDRLALDPAAAAVLAGLDPARIWAVLTRLADGDDSIPPPLEPMLPALAETVLHWSAAGRPVLVVHDEQSALTPGRLRRLQQALAAGGVSPLAGLVAVDSRDDPRVQVADLLAGLARRLPGPLAPLVSVTSLLDG